MHQSALRWKAYSSTRMTLCGALKGPIMDDDTTSVRRILDSLSDVSSTRDSR
jgi:hypothetical protein